VVARLQLCLSGGLSRRPQVLVTKSVGDGLFVSVAKRDSGVRAAATGEPACIRPLARTTVLETLRAKLGSPSGALAAAEVESGAAAEDPMADFAYDDTRGRGDPASPGSSAKKARRRRRTVGATVEKPVKVSMAAKAPEMHPDDPASVEVLLLNSAKDLWVHVDCLGWLLEFLRDQRKTAGVPAVPPRAGATRPPSAPTQGICWDFRDDAWVATGPDVDRRAIYVRKRTRTKGDPLFGMEWEAAKTYAYEELLAWKNSADTSAVAEPGRVDCSPCSSASFGVLRI
ncbi:MAG: hypothetical protein GY772_24280, partial [bacterium]|nr:hypothetical protein [bacterium]